LRAPIWKLSIVPFAVAAVIAGFVVVNRSPSDVRTVRLGTVRPDGQPVAEDSDGGHEIILASGCGTELWPVKTGADADRNKVSTAVVGANVTYLGSRPMPARYPTNNRIAPYELHTYQVTGYITQYKLEADSDIHLVLKDAANHSMIAEIPAPGCVSTASRWRTAIASTRNAWTTHYRTTTTWHYIHRSVTVRGLAFFDVPHGQTGKAPNAIELHPVIYLRFN